MGLKGELEKIVAREKGKIAKEAEANKKYDEECKIQFLSLANLLRELEDGIDEQYAKFEISESEATINIKVRNDVAWKVGIWIITCNGDYTRSDGIWYFKTVDGFVLEEKGWFCNVRNESSDFETFDNESEILEYIMKELGKRIAHYEKMDSK